MSNWFKTIVPNDRTWSHDLITVEKELKRGDAMDIARYLSTVLEHTDDPLLHNDNFTAIVNIKNGFIPSNGDYSGFSIEIEGTIQGEQVKKIAEQKMPDLNAASVETAMSMIAGTARSMGVEVVD